MGLLVTAYQRQRYRLLDHMSGIGVTIFSGVFGRNGVVVINVFCLASTVLSWFPARRDDVCWGLFRSAPVGIPRLLVFLPLSLEYMRQPTSLRDSLLYNFLSSKVLSWSVFSLLFRLFLHAFSI